MIVRNFALFIAASSLFLASCQTTSTSSQAMTQAVSQLEARPFSAEDKDWGVAPQDVIRKGSYHAPTPVTLPDGKVVATHALAKSLQGNSKPVLINVLTGSWVNALPGSVWLSGAGQGAGFDDQTQARLAKRLDELTGGDKAKPVVFYCLSSECWLSYNAALRAQRLGYPNVGWYRGGIDSWKAAGLPTERIDRDQW